jgi:hypothetical protein
VPSDSNAAAVNGVCADVAAVAAVVSAAAAAAAAVVSGDDEEADDVAGDAGVVEAR